MAASTTDLLHLDLSRLHLPEKPALEGLEVRFLANRDPELLFALLTDFYDADREELPADAPLLTYARRAMEELAAPAIASVRRKSSRRGGFFRRRASRE